MSILETALAFFVETNDSNVRREVIESYKKVLVIVQVVL